MTEPTLIDEARALRDGGASPRELVDWAKPHLRAHDEYRDKVSDRRSEDPPEIRERWSAVYCAIGGSQSYHRDYLHRARAEIRNEDQHGQIWSPATSDREPIDDGWNRWEVRVHFPLGIKLRGGYSSDRESVRRVDGRFRTKFFADRFVRKQQRRYARWILRAIREGFYDDLLFS